MKATPLFAVALASLTAAALVAAGCAPESETPAETPARTVPPKMKMTTDIPASITAPDKVATSIGTFEYFDGVPAEKTVETVYDYLDCSRAVEVFLNCIPAMSMYGIREGQAGAGADTCNKVCIVDTLLDSKGLFLTGNTSTMYAFGFLDLKKDGPTVIDRPPRMLGILDDMAFLYMTDLGVAGPDVPGEGRPLRLDAVNTRRHAAHQVAAGPELSHLPAIDVDVGPDAGQGEALRAEHNDSPFAERNRRKAREERPLRRAAT